MASWARATEAEMRTGGQRDDTIGDGRREEEAEVESEGERDVGMDIMAEVRRADWSECDGRSEIMSLEDAPT